MRVDMRFVILGPVEVSAAGRQLPHTAPRHRAVLAYLLLHSGIVISADRLIDAVWGQTPPDTARAQVHAAVTAIRRVLRSAGAAELLETRPAGYVIRPEAGQLDLEEFTGLVAAAQKHADEGDAATAIRELREALALWQGQPFAAINADYVDSARTILAERRLTAVERLADLELAQGRHEDLVDELTVLVAENPLRERLVGHLMLALGGRSPPSNRPFCVTIRTCTRQRPPGPARVPPSPPYAGRSGRRTSCPMTRRTSPGAPPSSSSS